MGDGQLKIDVLGASFTIQADEDPAYLKSVLSYLQRKVNTVQSAVPVEDPLKVAILAGFELVDELFKERRRSGASAPASSDMDELEEITVRLIDKLNKI
jgi:cell division protein ZapA (FtsZ GTPase activity inhibitor)